MIEHVSIDISKNANLPAPAPTINLLTKRVHDLKIWIHIDMTILSALNILCSLHT